MWPSPLVVDRWRIGLLSVHRLKERRFAVRDLHTENDRPLTTATTIMEGVPRYGIQATGVRILPTPSSIYEERQKLFKERAGPLSLTGFSSHGVTSPNPRSSSLLLVPYGVREYTVSYSTQLTSRDDRLFDSRSLEDAGSLYPVSLSRIWTRPKDTQKHVRATHQDFPLAWVTLVCTSRSSRTGYSSRGHRSIVLLMS